MQSCLLVAALEMELQATAGRLRQRTCKMTNYMCGLAKQVLTAGAGSAKACRQAARGCSSSMHVPAGAEFLLRPTEARLHAVLFWDADSVTQLSCNGGVKLCCSGMCCYCQ